MNRDPGRMGKGKGRGSVREEKTNKIKKNKDKKRREIGWLKAEGWGVKLKVEKKCEKKSVKLLVRQITLAPSARARAKNARC